VYAAEPYLLPGGLSGLDDLMDGLREQVEPGSAALWVHGVALGGENLFMVYLRWPEGPPVLLTLREGQWGRVETARTRHLLLLQLVLGGAPGDTKRWKAFMAAQADWQHDNAREEFETLLGGWGLEPLSDARWEDLVRVAYVNKSMLRLYQECARAMSEAPLLEAHGLLKAQADQFETQVKFFDKRKQELEKSWRRKPSGCARTWSAVSCSPRALKLGHEDCRRKTRSCSARPSRVLRKRVPRKTTSSWRSTGCLLLEPYLGTKKSPART